MHGGGGYLGARKCSQGHQECAQRQVCPQAHKPGWQNSSPGHTSARELLQKTLCLEKLLPPTLPICSHPWPWPQPPIYPIWCHLAPQSSCQSELRLARKSTFLDAETVQATRAWGIPGHVGTLAGPPLRSLLLEPRTLPWGWEDLAD